MIDLSDPFSQTGFPCKLDWGRDGARRAASAGDILVVVDALSFSTAVATAVERGCVIIPCTEDQGAAAVAERTGAEAAVNRRHVPERGRFSLSPLTYLDAPPGTRIALDSLNGATCSHYAREVPALFVGALVNAGAVARAVNEEMARSGRAVTVLACGERWSGSLNPKSKIVNRKSWEDGELRFAIEDYLAAGAIIAGIDAGRSPEARLCESAFIAARKDLEWMLRECGSGRELIQKGFAGDVAHAARLDIYASAPVMRDGAIVRRD